MNKLWAIFLSFFLFISTAYAESNRCPFVWKISKAGTPVSYLVGTIHINQKGRELSGCLKEIMGQSQLLMTETLMPVDLTETYSFELLQMLNQIATADPNNLRNQIGDDLHRDIKELWQKSETMKQLLPLYDNLHAWSVNMLMTNMTINTDLSEQNGIDYLLSQHAYQHKIRREGLESVMVGVKIFQDLPLEKHRQSLEITSRYIDETEKMNQQLIQLYNSGKQQEFFAFAFNDKEQFKFIPQQDRAFWQNWLYVTLLDERTASWLPKITAQLPRQSTVVAVGAMHTVGDNGLIELLKKQGYSLTPLE